MERTAAAPQEPVALRFTGQAGEYFRIWIVNLCLSVLTLGIYSAWAKVRRKRYFYGSTLLDVSAFEYTGNPVAILKGRLLVLAVFAVYSLAQNVVPLLSLSLALGAFALLPWIIQRALQFNARNSLHRNVRFGFNGSKVQIFVVLLIAALVVPVTLGLAYPWYLAMKRRLFVDNSRYGNQHFSFSATTGDYYRAALKVFLAILGFIAGNVVAFKISLAFFGFLAGSVTVGIGLLPFYLLLRAYVEVVFARLAWRNTTLADIRFDCGWTTGGLFKLYFANALGVLLSLGLLIPWAAIRTARYKLERMTLQSPQGPASFLAAVEQDVGAVGDEAGELLGFDFGL